MSRFSSSVTQNFIWIFRFRFAMLRRLRFHKGLGLSQQAIFRFRGRGPPKSKIRQWVLTGCACYNNPSLVFPSTNTTSFTTQNGKEGELFFPRKEDIISDNKPA